MLQARSFDERATGESAPAAIASAANRTTPAVHRAAWRFGKRFFDLAFALVALFLLAPTMCLVTLLVSLDGGPVLARHPRVGRGGQVFRCIKFRTVIDDAEESFSEYLVYNPTVSSDVISGRKLQFDPRVTAIGRALRSSGLDELPQLLNVLRGEMSVIGPKAEAPDAVHGMAMPPLAVDVRPGLTDLRQIDFRSRLGFGARFARSPLDGSAPKEFTVLARMLDTVLRRKGAL